MTIHVSHAASGETASDLPGSFRPAPIAVEVIAYYRGKCTRCGDWWRAHSLVAKTTAGQYLCWNCIRTIDAWLPAELLVIEHQRRARAGYDDDAFDASA